MTLREYYDGGQVIRVRGITQDPDNDRTWTYAWFGAHELQVGDQLILKVVVGKNNSREWEVEVAALGSDYMGDIAKIGGMYGLAYPALNQQVWGQ